MRVLFDVNVVLDVLLKREPWREDASKLWDVVALGQIEGYLAPTTITTIYYLARKLPAGSGSARKAVEACLRTFAICPVDGQTLDAALNLWGADFEDDVQIACALASGLDGIVTRNTQHFKQAPCRVFAPAELLKTLGESRPEPGKP